MKLPSLKLRVSSGKVGDHPLEAMRNSLEHRLLLKWVHERFRSLFNLYFFFCFHLLVRDISTSACLLSFLISLVVSLLQINILSIYLEPHHGVLCILLVLINFHLLHLFILLWLLVKLFLLFFLLLYHLDKLLLVISFGLNLLRWLLLIASFLFGKVIHIDIILLHSAIVFYFLTIILHVFILANIFTLKCEERLALPLFYFLILSICELRRELQHILEIIFLQCSFESLQIVRIFAIVVANQNIDNSSRSTHSCCSPPELHQLAISGWLDADDYNIPTNIIDSHSGRIIDTNTSLL
jgi:hypothetical protein